MKIKNKLIIILILIVFILGFLTVGIRLFSGEDSWIKDERGVYIKHGFPSQTPDYVKEQQNVLREALELYNQEKTKYNLSSQCLGSVNGYAVDIVYVPRTEEDNKPENQCSEYRQGKLQHFIELDKNGNIVRIV